VTYQFTFQIVAIFGPLYFTR